MGSQVRFLLVLLLCSQSYAEITPDLYSYTTSSAVNVNLTHTASGTDRILLVGINALYPAPSITSMNYGGYPLTPLLSTGSGGTGGEKRGTSMLYYLVNPPTGLKQLSVTVSGSGPYKAIWVSSFTGVDQDSPIHYTVTASGMGPMKPSCTILGASGGLIVTTAQVSTQGVVAKSGTLETTLFSISTTGITVCSTYRLVGLPNTFVLGWTAPSGTAYWTSTGVTLNPKDYGDPTNYTGVTAYQGGTWIVGISNTRTGVQILDSASIPVSNTQLSISNLGSCTPSYISLEVTTAGATLTLPSNTLSLRYHVSLDSGVTAYIYSSLISITNAKLDTGDSCGYLTFGKAAAEYPMSVPCNPLEDMRLYGPINIYFYSKGGCDIHLIRMAKIQ